LARVLAVFSLAALLLGLNAFGGARPAQAIDDLAPLTEEAARGLPSAQYTLGRHYLLNSSGELGTERGLSLLRQAAGQEYPPALLFLARVHERGIAVARDFVKAKGWYEKAAGLGIEAANLKLAPFKNVDSEQEFTLYNLPLARATPFALRCALQQRGAKPLKLMDGASCDTFASSKVLAGSDRARACYTDSGRLAHLEYRFPPYAKGMTPALSTILDRLSAKYGQATVTERDGVPLEYSWRLGGIRISFSMDHPSRTAFLRYSVTAEQQRYLREQKRREEALRPAKPEL